MPITGTFYVPIDSRTAEVRIDPSCRLRVSVRFQVGALATVQPGFGESKRFPGTVGEPGPQPGSAYEDGTGNGVGSDDDDPSVGRLTGDTNGVRSDRVSAALKARRCRWR